MTLSRARANDLLKKIQSNADSWSPQQVTVCGGGNSAHVAAGYFAFKGFRVHVLTRRPQHWSRTIKITTQGSSWEDRGTFQGDITLVSSDPAEVIPGSDLVLVAAPANAHPDILATVAPYVDYGAAVGAIFGQGGFDWAAKNAFGELFGNIGVLFGLQNIPWICKMTKLGKEAKIIGPKKSLYVATFPVEAREVTAKRMEAIFDIPCQTLPNFLNLTLTPSNQILHPARYYAIFRDWDGKKCYSKQQLEARRGLTLYDDFDEFSAETLAAIDNELQQVRAALVQRFPQLDLSFVLPIGERILYQYGEDVADGSSLKNIFNTNRGYTGCNTPLVEVSPDQFQPAVNSRLFWEDIPFGLVIIKSLAEMLGNFPTPTLDFLIRWHQQFMGKEYLLHDNQLNALLIGETGSPYKYGIHSLEDLVNTCLPKSMLMYRSPKARL
mmetsp:Transcript_18861/g.24307  ORF Transcript_18861/g.24307 Transcript_18861/m.24307 type:complete len:438 (-) Transcript_18861:281-1594(-)|eukprot:CAMPEP_0117854578 /NCGR_PEP_ID=MMETSP0950-20121206/99_1 /TAXON_ID=44440 /ORGANISM="Chattonella subsalsa, Strain CCMP2191" /LENGTH=437 /DNA_ID=CAMNT_0005703243 /DNA_START=83 /DNA_END=1396 /DNA_ORIENTATION=-